jgi:guanosine-3',5'-bis(diphosphate) 3'-pyrophosphohydrolase
MGLVLRALHFAADKHRDQRRKDRHASPHINHPIAVTETLWRVGQVHDAVTLAAALLHDTIEDTETTLAELTRAFGKGVASVVAEVTDDKTLHKKSRKRLQRGHAPHLSRQAKLKWSPIDGPQVDRLNEALGGRYGRSEASSIYRRLQGAGGLVS